MNDWVIIVTRINDAAPTLIFFESYQRNIAARRYEELLIECQEDKISSVGLCEIHKQIGQLDQEC